MADAAARREARRKRILENSHNRLQLISGKTSDDCPRVSPIRSLIPDQEREILVFTDSSTHRSSYFNNGVILNEPEICESLLPDNDIVAAGDRELNSDLAPFETPTICLTPEIPSISQCLLTSAPEAAQATSFLEQFITYKYDVVFLSVLIQLLDALSLMAVGNMYFFIPIICYTVTKFLWYPENNNSGLASALLLLNSPSSARIHKMFQVLQYSSVIGRDICIFLFTTICIQSLCFVLKESLIT